MLVDVLVRLTAVVLALWGRMLMFCHLVGLEGMFRCPGVVMAFFGEREQGCQRVFFASVQMLHMFLLYQDQGV